MNIHVIYRLCDKVDAVNGLPRPFGLTKAQVIKACFKSLMKSFENYPWAMTIVADDVSEPTREKLESLMPQGFKWIDITQEVTTENSLPVIPPVLTVSGEGLLNTAYIRYVNSNPPLRNAGSLLRAYQVADKIEDPETLIYFLEDDYLHNWTNFLPRLDDFLQFEKAYNFALPFFIHPSDYPDQYTRLLSRCYLFQTKYGYWREVCSTTGTFMCKAKTYKKFAKFLKECSTDDGKLSTIFKKEALCFSPMPGFATHMHEGVMGNYVDWKAILGELAI